MNFVFYEEKCLRHLRNIGVLRFLGRKMLRAPEKHQQQFFAVDLINSLGIFRGNCRLPQEIHKASMNLCVSFVFIIESDFCHIIGLANAFISIQMYCKIKWNLCDSLEDYSCKWHAYTPTKTRWWYCRIC